MSRERRPAKKYLLNLSHHFWATISSGLALQTRRAWQTRRALLAAAPFGAAEGGLIALRLASALQSRSFFLVELSVAISIKHVKETEDRFCSRRHAFPHFVFGQFTVAVYI